PRNCPFSTKPSERIQLPKRSYSDWNRERKFSKLRCHSQKSLTRYCRNSGDSHRISVNRYPSDWYNNLAQIPPRPKTASKSARLPSVTQNLRSMTNRWAFCHLGAVFPCVLAIISSATCRGASS